LIDCIGFDHTLFYYFILSYSAIFAASMSINVQNSVFSINTMCSDYNSSLISHYSPVINVMYILSLKSSDFRKNWATQTHLLLTLVQPLKSRVSEHKREALKEKTAWQRLMPCEHNIMSSNFYKTRTVKKTLIDKHQTTVTQFITNGQVVAQQMKHITAWVSFKKLSYFYWPRYNYWSLLLGTLFITAFAFDIYVSWCASSLLLYFCAFWCFLFNCLPYLVNKNEYIIIIIIIIIII